MQKGWITMLSLTLVLVLPPAAAAQQPGSQEDKFLLAVRTSDVATVKAMLAGGFNVNTKYRYDRMALSFASDRGNIEVVKALLDAGAEIGAADSFYSATAMDWALNKGHVEIVKLLFDRGAPNSEQTLMTGVNQNKPDLVRASLAKGGLSSDSLTVALARATRSNKPEIADLLRNAGAKSPLQLDAALLDKYAGTYTSSTGPQLTLTHKEGRFEGTDGGAPLLLLALDETTFRPEQRDGMTLKFNLDSSGTVTGFILKRGNNEIPYKRVEAKP